MTSDASGHRVDLFFDHETDALRVESPYTHPALRIWVRQPGSLLVRIPPWAEAGATPIADGDPVVADPPLNQPLTFELPLVEEEIALAHRTREIWDVSRGDEVVAMENFGAPLTYFDDW